MGSLDNDVLPVQTLDIDVFIKVLSNTILSPFFAAWVPIFYKTQGLPWTSPIILYSTLYVVTVLALKTWRWLDIRWSNGFFQKSLTKIDWVEQVVVITGGSSGLGLLLANTLAIRGVTVAVLDVVPLETENSNITYYPCDVSNWSQVKATADSIIADLGPPTILVNNAGVVQGKSIVELSEADVEQSFGVNIMAHFWTLKAFLPHMVEANSGHIITTASVMGMVGAAQASDYCASKAAAISLHESLRYELKHHYHAPNVRTTLLTPGYINTQMFAGSSYGKILRSSYLHRFFLPAVQPQDLVKATITAIDAQESRLIVLPFYVNFIRPLTAILPSWGRDFLQWISSSDRIMDGFVKSSGIREDETTSKSAAPKS